MLTQTYGIKFPMEDMFKMALERIDSRVPDDCVDHQKLELEMSEGVEWLENYESQMADMVRDNFQGCHRISIYVQQFSDASGSIFVFGRLETDEWYLVSGATKNDED